MNRLHLLLCGAIVGLLSLTNVVAAAPRIAFSPSGATAEGIQRGGEAVWFVHAVGDFSGMARMSRIVRVVADEDRDGIVALDAELPASSVWAVVDLATGEYAVARPEGALPLRELTEHGSGWGNGSGHLDFNVSEVDVLLVRPGSGVWELQCQQGGARDGDGLANNNLRVRLSDMKKLHGSGPTPPVALPRDLVIAVHPRRLLTFVRAAQEGKP